MTVAKDLPRSHDWPPTSWEIAFLELLKIVENASCGPARSSKSFACQMASSRYREARGINRDAYTYRTCRLVASPSPRDLASFVRDLTQRPARLCRIKREMCLDLIFHARCRQSGVEIARKRPSRSFGGDLQYFVEGKSTRGARKPSSEIKVTKPDTPQDFLT